MALYGLGVGESGLAGTMKCCPEQQGPNLVCKFMHTNACLYCVERCDTLQLMPRNATYGQIWHRALKLPLKRQVCQSAGALWQHQQYLHAQRTMLTSCIQQSSKLKGIMQHSGRMPLCEEISLQCNILYLASKQA